MGLNLASLLAPEGVTVNTVRGAEKASLFGARAHPSFLDLTRHDWINWNDFSTKV